MILHVDGGDFFGTVEERARREIDFSRTTFGAYGREMEILHSWLLRLTEELAQ
jgi:hypothetical protein